MLDCRAGGKKLLSFAGRLILTKAVLTAISVYSMSTIILPKSTLKRLDKISQDLFYGEVQLQKKATRSSVEECEFTKKKNVAWVSDVHRI